MRKIAPAEDRAEVSVGILWGEIWSEWGGEESFLMGDRRLISSEMTLDVLNETRSQLTLRKKTDAVV